MKKGLIGLLVIACLILGAAAVMIKLTEDHQPPEILIQDSDMTYTEGESFDALLEGVTATDNRDGDVTDSLVVENVYPVPDTATAQVVYVARDDSNNIAKASRTVSYVSGDGTEANAADEEASSETEGTEKTDAESSQTQTPTATATPTPTEEPEDEEDEELPEGSPRITLTTDAVTIEQGESINRIEYVKSIEDDKDEKNDLWRSIQIAGDEFDPDTPGTYEQIYYVIDSDGNRSNEATLTITVE